MLDSLIDYVEAEEENPVIHKFHIIELVLVGIYFLIFIMRKSIDFSGATSLWVSGLFGVLLMYQIVRISFEYKRQLITKGGIALKVFLIAFAAITYASMWLIMVEHPLANIVATSILLSMIFPYGIYAIALDNISSKTKVILAINSVCIAVLALGLLMAILQHPLASNILIAGLILTLVSLFSFIILKKGLTRKGKYHSINYFGRSLLLVILGLSYLL